MTVVVIGNLRVNIYNAVGKFSRWQTDDIFLIFSEKIGIDSSYILSPRQSAGNVKSYFLGKIRKIYQNNIC